MACYAPKPVAIWTNPKTKKREVIFMRKKDINLNKKWKYQEMLPCKKCIGCRIDHAREWACRAQLECKEYEQNYFITLTYTDKTLPKIENKPNIEEKDLTTFINSLRKKYERKGHTGIKYLASSEYGSKTARAHFHICVFNLPLTDLEKAEKSRKSGKQLYISKTIDKIWNKGMHKIGILNYETAGYTASYTFKKLKTEDYKALGINPEKLRMSNGIGLEYFKKNYKKIYENDNMSIMTKAGTKIIRPPKYFDRKLEEIDKELTKKIKKNRIEKAITRTEETLRIKQQTYLEYNKQQQKEIWKKLKNKKTL